MEKPPSRRSRRRLRATQHVDQEEVLVRVFAINGDTVTSALHHCIVLSRSLDGLRLISLEALPVGQRIDITIDLDGGLRTFSGIPRNLAVAYESSGFLVDVELIQDRHAAGWRRRFH